MLVVLVAGYAVAAAGLVVLAWKALAALATVTRADARERDRDRRDLLTMISHLVEDARVADTNRMALQCNHATERMDTARSNVALETNSRDGLVREPVHEDRFAPSMPMQ